MKSIQAEICENFAWLCRTPHPSGQEAALAARVVERLRGAGYAPWQDACGNIFCDIPSAQTAPCTALQAHLDMVCAVGSPDYVPERDPIRPIVRDGWLCTAGESSLGADCGAGAAVMLWLADHPVSAPVRLIFTVAEEIGLHGARELDAAGLTGIRHLLNLDGFRWGRVVTGCAGGVRERHTRALTLADAPALPNGCAYRLTLDGFRGGHSGFDIGERRANAVLLMGELLRELRMESPFALIDFHGGTTFNAIPYHCTAEVLTIAPAEDVIRELGGTMLARWKDCEPDAALTVESRAIPQTVWNGDAASGLLTALGGFADGVYARHPSGAVSDSSNLGHVYRQADTICLDAMMRCMDADALKALEMSHRAVCGMCGFQTQTVSAYPAWNSPEQAHVRTAFAQAYQSVTGQPPEITVQHVGLEPALFMQKNPEMACICIGMELRDCHAPQERWQIASIEPFVETLRKTLEAL